jgi:hypothetical protein
MQTITHCQPPYIGDGGSSYAMEQHVVPQILQLLSNSSFNFSEFWFRACEAPQEYATFYMSLSTLSLEMPNNKYGFFAGSGLSSQAPVVLMPFNVHLFVLYCPSSCLHPVFLPNFLSD